MPVAPISVGVDHTVRIFEAKIISGILAVVPVIVYVILELGLKKKLPTKNREMA